MPAISKGTALAAVLASAMLAGAAWSVSRSEFSDRSKAPLAPSYQNDGNALVGLSVSITSDKWTTIKLSNAVRRRLYVHVLDAGLYGVCVSTINTVGYACADGTPGIELTTKKHSDHVFFTEASLYARTRDGVEVLKGYEAYDSGD